MKKLTPLATLKDGVITIDPKHFKKIVRKYKEIDSHLITDWLNDELYWATQYRRRGYFLVFVRLNPLGARVYLTKGDRSERTRITDWYSAFKVSKCRK